MPVFVRASRRAKSYVRGGKAPSLRVLRNSKGPVKRNALASGASIRKGYNKSAAIFDAKHITANFRTSKKGIRAAARYHAKVKLTGHKY